MSASTTRCCTGSGNADRTCLPPLICLLTPGHLSTNPRLVKEADALAAAGYEVRVIAADFALWARDADRSFKGRSWRVARTLPFGPSAPRRARIVQVSRQRLTRVLTAVGARHSAIVRSALHPIAPDLVSAAKRVPADLYIAHYPAALPAAAIAARARGALYAFDAEDFHLGDTPEGPAHEAERRMIRAIESRYLPGCAYVTAASPDIADAYVQTYGIPSPTVVLNVFPRSQAPSCPTPAGTAVPGPSLYWFSQTIGPKRGLECAVRAIGQARIRPHLYLRGTPAAGYLDQLRAIAAEVGAVDRLHILPPATPSEMERLAAPFDLGLSGEPGHTPNNRIALGNKLFSYLLAGLPIVASSVPSHLAFADEFGGAMNLYPIDDATSLADALDSLLSDSRALAAARAAAWRLGQERFNWEAEQVKLVDRVRSVLEQCGQEASIPVADFAGPVKASTPFGHTV